MRRTLFLVPFQLFLAKNLRNCIRNVRFAPRSYCWSQIVGTALALAASLLAAPILLAQQPAQQPQAQSPPEKKAKPANPADVETLTGNPQEAQARPGGEATPRSGHPLNGQPAPKLGHPLDPADVDVLTGKANGYGRSAYPGYVTPYVYPAYPAGGSEFEGSQFGSGSTATSPFFVPRAFGRIGNRSFILLGTTTGRTTLFFAPGVSGRRSSFFFIP